MRVAPWLAAAGLALAMGLGNLQAQPANDNFTNAWRLSGTSLTTNGNSTGATMEPGEPYISNNSLIGGRSVWFWWTAPVSGTTRIDTVGSGFNTLLGVYLGQAVNALSIVATNDDYPGLERRSLVEFFTQQGTTYRIKIEGRGNWGGAASGNYTLRLQVLASVFLSSPTNGSVFAHGTPIPITVSASAPSGIARVDFYANGSLIGSDTTDPYSLVWSNAPLGTNVLTAVAYDPGTNAWSAPAVRILVLEPGVTITSPADGQYFYDTSPITVSAVGLLASGTLTNVAFYANNAKFADDPTSPFSGTWSGVTEGVHRLWAVGTDNAGHAYTSAPVFIGVAQTLIPTGSIWQYHDLGQDLGTAWRERDYDDSAWASGPAPLGYDRRDDGAVPTTVVSYGPDPNNKYPTTYFRHSLLVSNPAAYTNLLVRIQRDDGAVVYINGTEVGRFNMPAGTIRYTNWAAATAADDGVTVFTTNASAALLVPGTNVVAVEIHQVNATSSDIWFELSLLGLPVIPRNQPPLVTLTSPTNGASFLAPASLTLTATASDPDGSVVRVEFLVNGVKVGEATTSPYSFVWGNPPLGWHTLQAVAYDDRGASGASAPASISVYDAVGTPLVAMTSPAEGAVFDGPTNLTLAAQATAPAGITNVLFLTNGVPLGNDPTSPYSWVWTNAAWGTNRLTAVASDSAGRRGTSAVVTVIVNPPPPNLFAPTIANVVPARGSSLTNLTTIQVTFSEVVVGVDAADLLINSRPAVSVTGSGSNYTFTVTPPGVGVVSISWATNHGIVDVGHPPLPFDATAPGATWTYSIVDLTPPTVVSQNPPAGATVSNLTAVTVVFSEPVQGVDAADFLVNGAPAFGLSGGEASWTFSFSQPPPGTVRISWAMEHGITDLSPSANPFNATGPGATWTYTLDNRTVLVASNTTWRFLKGFAEASAPPNAWRQLNFDDSGWSNAPAPFFYGDPYSNNVPAFTLLSDMQGNYSSIYLRRRFVLPNAAAATNLFLVAQCDDGFIAWINGVEVLRYNMPAGEIPYNGVALGAVNEPNNTGAAYISHTLPDPRGYLVDGTNVLAVHAFNASLAGSSDFGFNAQLYTFLVDASAVAPRLVAVAPPAGTVYALSAITVTFSEPVTSVDAADLLINGVPASSVSGSNAVYTFSFTQPAWGQVTISWAANHGIVDLDVAPKPFDATAAGSTWSYTLLNPNVPMVAAQTPGAGATVGSLTQVTVVFNKPVTGVDAGDLLVNGAPATGLIGSGTTYTFSFPQPPYGAVSIGWVANHGIRDLESPPNAFDPSRPGCTWSYTLVDLEPPAIASVSPPPGAKVTNLTAITVTFTEPVTGVEASDLLVNGVPATGLSGAGASWTFQFPQPNASVLVISWALEHGIRDLASPANYFDATEAGASWSYTTPDTVPPVVVRIEPPPYATLPSLRQIRVSFSEPVAGVDTNDLLLNNVPAWQVSGSSAGPYVFTFLQPSNGPVELRWAADHGITDLADPPNPFGGGDWTYIVERGAVFAGAVVINEIMFNPAGGAVSNEWIELRNLTGRLINLAGWRFSRGVSFTFPNVSIPPGGYLVVAANVEAFRANYPTVTNVVGGWVGRLANDDETIELVTALGEVVNSVHYASEGDWARRERGRGAELVSAITRSGTTARVYIFGHDYTVNDVVLITGADQPQYNGFFTVSSVASDSFTVTVSGNPPSPATGRIICRQVVDNGASGWSWFCEADGFGSSLELVNPALPNTVGQNWRPSTVLGGTPGRVNSVNSSDVAPLILEVAHHPPVPRSTNPIVITARVRDEFSDGVMSVTLFYRNHSVSPPGPFLNTPMYDDGTRQDGLAEDGVWGAVLPRQTNGTIIEFYLQATDINGFSRIWPAPTWDTNNTFGQLANALVQVHDEPSVTNMPFLRLVLTETERAQFAAIDTASDAEMNATLVSVDGDGAEIRYLCGVRIRGAGSRSGQPKNYRLNLPTDHRWKELNEVNLNCRYTHAQLAGSALAQRAGLPCADARVVQLRLNGQNMATLGSVNYGTYLVVEPINGDWAANHFPLDPDGNVYRGSKYPWNANLDYLGTNAATYYGQTGAGYYKTSNRSENDWSDLIALTWALSTNTPDAVYVEAVRTNAHVEEWMLYFAVCNFFDYMETSLCRGVGDDYAMYRGNVDRRFKLVAHDFDTILGQGDTAGSTTRSIWVMIDNPPSTDPTMRANFLARFLRHPEFAPIYLRTYKRLLDTVFAPEQLDPVLDQMLGYWVPASTLQAMKTFAANRRAYVLSQIPMALTVNSSLPTQSGYLFTTSPSTTLFGQANVLQTSRVLVNGRVATWVAWQGRWTNSVSLQPGINRVLVQAIGTNNLELERATLDIWYDDGSVLNVSGTLAGDTVWSAGLGPYQVTGTLTVPSGVTLTIQAGTTVYLGSGVNLVVANGGRLLAEGTPTAPIRFSRVPGSTGSWGGIIIQGGPNSPESRLTHAHIEFNGNTAIQVTDGTVYLASLSFGNTARQYLSLDRASFVVEGCVFPSATAEFELVHGSGGIKAGGRGIFVRNFFGAARGYNDVVDFTGGQRPGPVVQFLGNVFMGSGDDLLDLDDTDAWIEGNIFLHAHKNGSPDTASGISAGSDTGQTSELTIVRNIFYDCDHAVLAKQGNFYVMLNNTVVRQTRVGGQDTEAAVLVLADNNMSEGAGVYLEGNIIWDAEALVRNRTNALVTFTNNLLPMAWTGPGGGNLVADPLFRYVPALAETTNFTSWAAAQVFWDWFSLRPGSPAQGAGAWGQDLGAVVPAGVWISGEPSSPTPRTEARLVVGWNRTGSGIPTGANQWPAGAGYTHYRWRLDGGNWSAETPITQPIQLTGLRPGPHWVEVSGRRDSGFYQDNAAYGPEARTSRSRLWTVAPGASTVRLNEILASNRSASNHWGTTPDLVELYNDSPEPVDLSGLRLTDDPLAPDKFVFPPGASIGPWGYLVVFANDPDGTPGYHLGFGLNQDGDGLWLYDRIGDGGALLDWVAFGPQLTDLSIGRLVDGSWGLCQPTFGGPNRPAPMGDPRRIRINEWLAAGTMPIGDDFVELYNPDPRPVNLGGLYISDEILGWPTRHPIPALSFIAGYGYLRFIADDQPELGPQHLSFRLNNDQGAIGLYAPDLSLIDLVLYGPQWPNISQGRSPNGSSTIAFFSTPTPGAPNPLVSGPAPFGGMLVINEVLALNATGVEPNGRTPDWVELYNGTTNTVDLSDLSLSDDSTRPRRWVFPAGTQLAPGGYLRVLCDGGAPASTNNTGFGLRSTGGAVYLFDAPVRGGSLLDAISYGLQVADLSIGRVPNGSTNWVLTYPTPAAANLPVTSLGNPARIRVNEWMADPGPGLADWFELYNPEPSPVAIGGLYLTDDLNNRTRHRIAPLSFLGTGPSAWTVFIADGNSGAGADHVNFALRAAGEALGLFSAEGILLDGYVFGPQQQGVSEGRFPDGAEGVVRFPGTASPGQANWRWLTTVAISEVLSHTPTNLPLEDAIELHNLTSQPLNIGGWWLSDDPGTPQKFQIPSPTILPPRGFVVFYESQFNNRDLPNVAIPFAFSATGDEAVLSQVVGNTLTGWRTQVRFGPADPGVSFGRYLTSDGRTEFVAMSRRTFGVDDPASVEEFRESTGASNAYPRVGPVVISEIMYHPPDLGTNDNTRDEYIELHNITTAPVPLYDPAHPTNTWHLRDAVDFEFPTGAVLPPGGYLLVVGFDPVNNPGALAAFKRAYNLADSVTILGPWRGRLANSSDEIELRKPGAPTSDEVPYVLVEKVRYSDTYPWPPEADGTGWSLHRREVTLFGNDPTNWVAGPPTPGPQAAPLDADNDGLPDWWETAHGLDPQNPADASLDFDGDGLTNLQEYLAGTHPRDPTSTLRIDSIELSADRTQVTLSFTAQADRTYTVEACSALGGGVWQSVADLDAAPTNRTIRLSFPTLGGLQFFRLRTPWRISPQAGLRIDAIEPVPGRAEVVLRLQVTARLAGAVEFAEALDTESWTPVATWSAAPTNQVLRLTVPALKPSGFYRLRAP